MKGICLAVLWTRCQSIHAQEEYTLSGFAKDIASGEALYRADVIVGSSKGTTTDEYGYYSITVPKGCYSLSIGYLGFTTITKQINLEKDIKRYFELTEQVNELMYPFPFWRL